ncbi:hypothetical protein CMI37_18235 [Candidatus Pacearchaeota archaeon]|nr:hypothetical protein [Candidatus Pacearchaeota archaeon]|tara:strand:- start:7642 stop:7854 length:213 start_codon:yes stop_codon:yes gene_type:complete
MIQFEYSGVMKRYDVKVPSTIASISEDEDARITLHRQVSLRLLKQIILNWDEYEHQMSRESDNLKKEGDK